jgi:hypothetical protein
MTDTLTACARAICRANALHSPIGRNLEAVECQVENGWDMWLPEARACLTALAENVSKEMVKAMQATFARHCDQRGSFASIILNTDAELIVRNMIRAAVGEK